MPTTYRVEYRHTNCGWVLRGNLSGLTRRRAESAKCEEEESETYYARLGARKVKLRVAEEKSK